MERNQCLTDKCKNSIGNIVVQSKTKMVDYSPCNNTAWREDLSDNYSTSLYRVKTVMSTKKQDYPKRQEISNGL